MNIQELNELYDDAKAVDKEMLAEYRNAILMVSGEHYNKKLESFWNRTKTQSPSSEGYRIKITKNWMHRAHRLYVSSILSSAPNAAISPRNPLELQDQKDAELCTSVWHYLQSVGKLKPMIREWCSDYVLGECCALIKYNPNAGELVGYEPILDENGQPVMQEDGTQAVDSKKPVFQGQIEFERVYPHTLFRHPNAKKMDDSPFLGIEKMVSTKDLKKKYKDDKEKLRFIEESQEELVVFNANKAGFTKESKQTLLKEVYFKPSEDFPNGWYYIYTKAGILADGELPFGIFPVVWKGFDEAPTRARATGIVKVGRPFQSEINRASSQLVMNSITQGEDKVFFQAGSKIAPAQYLAGVRGFTHSGAVPTVIQGRAGDQFYQYIATQEQELNRALMLDLLDVEKVGQLEPYTLMFRSMQQKQAFSMYSDKFGEFLVEICEKSLALAKEYLSDDEVIAAVGKSEVVNLAEFRKTTPLSHRIHVEEGSEDVSSKLGRILTMNQLIQYAGTQLTREDIGKLSMNMPYGNWKEQFSDFTIDERNFKNDCLAIERGEQPMISASDNSEYILRKFATRKKERDFGLLPEQIIAMYNQYEQIHIQKLEAEGQAAKAASSEMIPTGGSLISCDLYLPTSDPKKIPKRARLPYQAVEWLIQVLEKQGMAQEKLDAMNPAQIMQLQQGQQPMEGATGVASTNGQMAQAEPMGVQ